MHNINKTLLVCSLACVTVSVHAERYVVARDHAPPMPYTVVRDLAPLPWRVIALPSTRRTGTGCAPCLEDVRGWFAADTLRPNDPDFAQQWQLRELDALSAWPYAQGQDIAIALVDTGVMRDHPDLVGALRWDAGYDFGDQDVDAADWQGHGTLMAGLIAARCFNGLGGCGIAPLSTLIPYKINEKDSSTFTSSNLASAIVAAADQGAVVINLSLVLPQPVAWVTDAIRYAMAKGSVVVAAAGNQGGVAFPASLPEVVAVAALGTDGQPLFAKTYSSTTGIVADTSALKLTAPGNALPSTDIAGGTFPVNRSSSAAAALTSGVLALWAQATGLRGQALAALVMQYSHDAGELGFDPEYGFGKLRALPAVLGALALSAPLPPQFTRGQVVAVHLSLAPAPGQGALFLRLSLPDGQAGRQQQFLQWGAGWLSTRTSVHGLFSELWDFSAALVNVPLTGPADALLGRVTVDSAMPMGWYELSAEFAPANAEKTLRSRAVVWLDPTDRATQ